ncbi:MAG: nicotinamide mononucleotide (NMN) deamidase PncC [Vicingaceae bacterium]|jgi:nicotinamide mononucleotide (NMN) deamidase PncC
MKVSNNIVPKITEGEIAKILSHHKGNSFCILSIIALEYKLKNHFTSVSTKSIEKKGAVINITAPYSLILTNSFIA